jgi:hypothetical protein
MATPQPKNQPVRVIKREDIDTEAVSVSNDLQHLLQASLSGLGQMHSAQKGLIRMMQRMEIRLQRLERPEVNR